MSLLGPDQIRRYARHILLPDIGGVGQARLLASAVAAAPDNSTAIAALAYLAAAGVGRLVLTGAAGEPVTEAEVAHGILYGKDDVGQPRIQAIAGRIRAINPDVRVELATERQALDPHDAIEPVRLAPLPAHDAIWLDSEHPDDAAATALVRGGLRAIHTLVELVHAKPPRREHPVAVSS